MQALKSLVSAPILRCRKVRCTIACVVWKRWRKVSRIFYSRGMPAVLFFRIGNGPNATRAMYAACIVYATCVVNPICIADAARVAERFTLRARPAPWTGLALRNDLGHRCDFDFVENDPRMRSFLRQRYRIIKNGAYLLHKLPGQKLLA